jgi:hypothetical protein
MTWEMLQITIPAVTVDLPTAILSDYVMPDGSASGQNCMVTIKRLVVAGNDMIYYETVGVT